MKCYIELRTASARGSNSLAVDITRHIHTRQYLGKAVVVCDDPHSTLSNMRKQWLKISRLIQRQRAGTLNADKILKYTHAITHMQYAQFTAKTPLEQPDADFFIVSADEPVLIPPQCWSVYLPAKVNREAGKTIVGQLPGEALVVDYNQLAFWEKLGLEPKTAAEKRVREEWQQAQKFLSAYKIDISSFKNGNLQNVDAIDDALDILLGVSHKFLPIAFEFQRALELARPMRINKELREEYDSLILLGHRVQALSPGAFSQRFLETYNENDAYFLLQDIPAAKGAAANKNLSYIIARHSQAGRSRLALALLERFGRR